MTYQLTPVHIVEMHFSDHVSDSEFQHWLSDLEQLILQKNNFVIVMQTLVGTSFTDHYRQLQSVWYKKYKQDFYQYCIGLVRIAQDDADLQRLNTPALHNAWRVPYYVTLTRHDALQWAMERWS